MSLKIIIVSLFAFFCLTGFSEQSNSKLQSEFESRFEEYSKLIKTIKCDFTQEKTMSVLENTVSMKGHFYYDSKGDICLDYLNPTGNKIIFSSDKFMMLNSGEKTVANLSSNPMLRQLSEMLTACMTGDVSKFRVGWEIEYAQNNEEYILRLIPTNRRVSKMINSIVLHFIKTDMSLAQMKMNENGGDVSVYKFFNKIMNGELDPRVFDLK